MDTRFVLPVTTAAALHAFLFWGFGNGNKPPHKPMAKSPAIVCDFFQFVLPPEPPPEPLELETTASKGSAESEVPSLPEQPTSARSPFEMPPLPSYPAPKNPVDRIPFQPPGNPDGILSNSVGPIAIDSVALDNPPRARSQTPPAYPVEARRLGLKGEVVVDLIVDATGRVKTARVVQSTDRQFEEPTLRAVQHWRFQPGKKNGRPVSFRMVAPVVFSLSD